VPTADTNTTSASCGLLCPGVEHLTDHQVGRLNAALAAGDPDWTSPWPGRATSTTPTYN
jgi:hypothetical protein